VYQARPYVSPDTREWVISNSTLMPSADGSKQATVHFEVTIASFRKVAASLANQFDITVIGAAPRWPPRPGWSAPPTNASTGGYPDGLAADQIPLGARIIAVCDAFTAMTSDRPFAARRTIPEAVAELRRAAGGQFDPAVVGTFSELVVDLIWPAGPDPDQADAVRHHA
jgi:hypothetical protein